MIDTTTRHPLYVSTDGDAGPCIIVPVAQLEGVIAILDARTIPYWADEEAISLDGKPEVAVINLPTGSDPATVQGILDGIP